MEQSNGNLTVETNVTEEGNEANTEDEEGSECLSPGLDSIRKTKLLANFPESVLVVRKRTAPGSSRPSSSTSRSMKRMVSRSKNKSLDENANPNYGNESFYENQAHTKEYHETVSLLKGSVSELSIQAVEEFRNIRRPVKCVLNVGVALMCLFASVDSSIPISRGKTKILNKKWTAVASFLGHPGRVMEHLKKYKNYVDRGHVKSFSIQESCAILRNEEMTLQNMQQVHPQAQQLLNFVLCAIKYYQVKRLIDLRAGKGTIAGDQNAILIPVKNMNIKERGNMTRNFSLKNAYAHDVHYLRNKKNYQRQSSSPQRNAVSVDMDSDDEFGTNSFLSRSMYCTSSSTLLGSQKGGSSSSGKKKPASKLRKQSTPNSRLLTQKCPSKTNSRSNSLLQTSNCQSKLLDEFD